MTNELATGGTITIDTPTLVEHRFTSGGTFALINPGTLVVDYLVAGGGGGGGGNAGGGGGGGQVLTGTSSITSSHTVTIGSGGLGGTTGDATQGGTSSFGVISSATGGGRGGDFDFTKNGGNGGNGGGGSGATSGGNPAGGTGTQFNGGNGHTSPGVTSVDGGGGGGAGGAGENAETDGVGQGGDGGIGLEWPTSSGVRYGGGGGGSGQVGAGTGGAGGGGNGGLWPGGGGSQAGFPGTVNTGGGGGGGSINNPSGGAGGSGVVVIRYDPSTDWTPAATVPDPPTGVTAVAGNGEATVSFTPPVDDGGSAIIDYTATSSPGGFTQSGAASPIVVTGLTNGVSYTFTVIATNAIGDSSPSSASNSVTPSAPVFGAYPSYITAQLLDYDGSVLAPGTQLDNGFDINWYDELDGPGRGGCSLSLSEAGSADLLPGRYINCLANGVVRFTFKIEGNPNYKIIERGEEHDQIIEVQGRGWGCVLDETTTFPDYSLQFSLETTWRLFSFASPSFPNAGSWGAAVEQAEYLEGVATAICYGHFQTAPDGLNYPAPIGFPWPTNPANLVMGVPTANYVDTFWIRTDNQPDYTSPGYWLFLNEFTLTEFTPVTFTVTADNFFTFFVEGVPILGEEISVANHWMWQGWKEHQIGLPAGTYTVGAVVYNIAFSDLGATPPYPYYPPCPAEGWAGGNRDSNPGGLLASIYIDGESINPPTPVLMTNDTWIGYYDPITWPGWTPGQIIEQLISEAIAGGYMTVFDSDTFDVNDDSNGDEWRPVDVAVTRPDMPMLAVEVGTSLMTALDLLVEQGYIHWHVQPGTFVLDVYRGRVDTTPTIAAELAGGVNLVALERNATAPYANALLVQWSGGYVTVEDAVEIAAYGTKVGDVFNSDAPSADEAELQGRTELLRRAQSQFPAIVVVVEPTSSADCPYESFTVGDYVTIAMPAGDEDVRCWSITCRQDDMGYAVWSAELNAKLDVPERRRTELLQTIGGKNQIVRGSVS